MLGFTDAPSDHAANLRQNPQWLTEKWADQSSKVLVFIDERPAIIIEQEALEVLYLPTADAETLAPSEQAVLLNIDGQGRAVFGIMIADTKTNQLIPFDHAGEIKLIDLRSLAMQAALPADQLGTLAQARSLLSWHHTHKFCACCSAKTAPRHGGAMRKCTDCGKLHFPRVDPVVIMLVQHGDDYLMGRGHNFAANHYSALAGFVEPGETLEAAVCRETFEETGIHVADVSYMMSQPWPFPSSLMIGVHARAKNKNIILDEKELADARWFSSAEIRAALICPQNHSFTLPPPMTIAGLLLKEHLLK